MQKKKKKKERISLLTNLMNDLLQDRIDDLGMG
jgi:hypothetical protein